MDDFKLNFNFVLSRTGRTGRAGATGIAISFMTREDWSKAEDLINILREAGQVCDSISFLLRIFQHYILSA